MLIEDSTESLRPAADYQSVHLQILVLGLNSKVREDTRAIETVSGQLLGHITC